MLGCYLKYLHRETVTVYLLQINYGHLAKNCRTIQTHLVSIKLIVEDALHKLDVSNFSGYYKWFQHRTFNFNSLYAHNVCFP